MRGDGAVVRVVHVVGKMNRGGLETFIMNVIRNTDTSQIKSDILCTIAGAGDYDADVRNLGSSVFNIGDRFQSHTGKTRFLHQYIDYIKWFKENPYDVVHIHGSHAFDNAIAVKAALDVGQGSVISHSHTNNGVHRVLNAVGALYLRKAPIVRLACSCQAGEWLYGKPDCFEVVQNGVDVSHFSYSHEDRSRCRASLGLSENVKVIAHTGRLVEVKNQAFLLDVLRALANDSRSEWALLLIGEGSDEGMLREKARSLGIENNIKFLGLCNDVSPFLSAADIYAMPSLHEGLPLAAVEAQASGLATFISGGMSPETKLLPTTKVLALDLGAGAWAQAIKSASLCAPSEADRAQAADGVRAAGFDIEKTVERLQSIYCQEAQHK